MDSANASQLILDTIVLNGNVLWDQRLARSQIPEIQLILYQYVADEEIVITKQVFAHAILAFVAPIVDKCIVSTIAMGVVNVSVWVWLLLPMMVIASIAPQPILNGTPICSMDVNVMLAGEVQIAPNGYVSMV